MKNALALVVVFAASFLASPVVAQTILARWTFETAPPADQSNSTTVTGIAADVGTGIASGLHAGSATDWSTPAGNGSANALSANTWSSGDFFQFQTSTTGFRSIAVSWDQIGSSTGPRDFSLLYSANGSEFSVFASYTVAATPAWSSTTPQLTSYSYNLSSISSLSSISGVYFRLMVASSNGINGSAITASGTSRIDNFTITGTPIPEPSTYAAIFGAVALAGVAIRRRWQRTKVAGV